MSKIIKVHRQKATDAAIEKCVHFGFCTAVCPTYVLDGEENDSPRGRIALAKEMLAGGPPSEKAIKHLDRCLSCLSCETTCAANVPYREIIDSAREYIELSRRRPWMQRLFRSALAQTLTTPMLLRVAYHICAKLPRAITRLPGSVGTLAALTHAPVITTLNSREAGGDIISAQLSVSARKVGLLTGCVQSVIGGEINAATIRFLNRFNVSVLVAEENQCCGALELHMGKRKSAIRKSAQLVINLSRLLRANDIEAVVTTTSGCHSVIQHFDDLLSQYPELAADIALVTSATKDITELALELQLKCVGVADGAVVAYHDACSMMHGLKLTTPPRKLLRTLNFDCKDIAESHLCCGSAGVYNILQPDIATRLGIRKAKNASAGSPDVIAAGNLGCLVQISRFTDVPITHTVQLLDWATGGPTPRGLEGFQPRRPSADSSQERSQLADAAAADTFW